MLIKTFPKIFFVILFVGLNGILSCQDFEHNDTLYIANWNVENLFDTDDDPLINDSEFLPNGKKEWTEDRLERKLNNLTHVINYMNNGCGPDIIGFEEVENINVLKRLIYKLPGRNYIMAHRDSPDARGIDACMFYDRSIFDIIDLVPITVKIPTGHSTRDILHVTLKHKKYGDIIHVFVNHWPSRLGGEKKSERNRIAAANILRTTVDSLFTNEDKSQIIIIGDFNDEPNNESIEKVLSAKNFYCGKPLDDKIELLNLSYKSFLNNEGSYLYGSDWNMLDQIIVSQELYDNKGLDYKCDSFEIVKPEFMQIKTGDKAGAPLSTYKGSKYLGGYSDHFPVAAKFYFMKGK
jgi:hypothetical protein